MLELDKNETEYKQTTVEEGTQFKGTLESTCQVMVRGVVDGELTAPSLVVAETGTVTGNVKAQTIQSNGVLAGRIEADDIYLSGSVRSDTVIRAKTMEVKLQSTRKKLEVTFGECILDVGDDPATVSAAVPTTTSPSPAATSGKKAARRGETTSSSETASATTTEGPAADSSNGTTTNGTKSDSSISNP